MVYRNLRDEFFKRYKVIMKIIPKEVDSDGRS
ncbi:hypothetical protein Arcpr_0836 [Archaeoglobus profundus DSM 5631]|uniref:Uncharacterized protein n=1 Tax=Archaeoglobus profundus (strain DSM 5631 / JCM 9629 / NBRC 100127 / Av18) TaxID=572546 RepID=D2RHX4_ARCPA|nr:hypothetical protein Arcpr_0836 [Archaeoglobus profundus DSM 5631]